MDDERIAPENGAVEPASGAAAEAAEAAPTEPESAVDPSPSAEGGSAAAQTELPIRPKPTGEPAVDATLERLRDVESAPLEQHVEIFDDVQRQLHDALAELDDEQ